MAQQVDAQFALNFLERLHGREAVYLFHRDLFYVWRSRGPGTEREKIETGCRRSPGFCRQPGDLWWPTSLRCAEGQGSRHRSFG
jgi:hypothetical protein